MPRYKPIFDSLRRYLIMPDNYGRADKEFRLRLEVLRRWPEVELNSDEFFRKLRELRNNESSTSGFGEITCKRCGAKPSRSGIQYCTRCGGRFGTCNIDVRKLGANSTGPKE